MEFLSWLWQAITDDSIIAAVKPRMILFGTIATILGLLVKRTKSTFDNEAWAALKDRFFPTGKIE